MMKIIILTINLQLTQTRRIQMRKMKRMFGTGLIVALFVGLLQSPVAADF
jgi:hypothetical protein